MHSMYLQVWLRQVGVYALETLIMGFAGVPARAAVQPEQQVRHREQLVELNRALKAAGIVPVCDIVINHRCADQQDEHGVWNRFGCGTPSIRTRF